MALLRTFVTAKTCTLQSFQLLGMLYKYQLLSLLTKLIFFCCREIDPYHTFLKGRFLMSDRKKISEMCFNISKKNVYVLELQLHLNNVYMILSKVFHSLITQVFKEECYREKLSSNHHWAAHTLEVGSIIWRQNVQMQTLKYSSNILFLCSLVFGK